MKKWLVLMLVFLLVPVLCACGGEKPEEELTQPVTIAPVTQPTTAPVKQPTEPATTPPAPTEPAHSEFYLADYTPEQVTEYFEEVVLAVEYTDGTGDASLVQKWLSPIRYGIYGDPTDEDLAVLEDFFSQLNAVPGFPGIRPAEAGEGEELTLSFLNKEDFNAAFSDVVHGEDAFGAVEFWYYTDSNEIYSARIGYRTDIDQQTRNSVLPEEIVNMLGISDTELREDSIVYQYSNDNLSLSDMDWLILKLLYDPAISSGANAPVCRIVIENLYY